VKIGKANEDTFLVFFDKDDTRMAVLNHLSTTHQQFSTGWDIDPYTADISRCVFEVKRIQKPSESKGLRGMHGPLHRHPYLEGRLLKEEGSKHVIVDVDDWQAARKQNEVLGELVRELSDCVDVGCGDLSRSQVNAVIGKIQSLLLREDH